MKQIEVSRATMGRLPVYLKYLKNTDPSTENISATALAKELGLGEVQVRKDLGAVSGAGRPKTGYRMKRPQNALFLKMMLDFSIQTSTEISRTIRALHPFLPTYITHKNAYFIVDPYNFRISDKIFNYPPDSIINKNATDCSITIVCKDSKAICFKNLKLYKRHGIKKYINKYVEITK